MVYWAPPRAGATQAPASVRRVTGGQRDHHRHAQRRGRQDAHRPQLPDRVPPPRQRESHAPGRQGRQHRPRAQDARRAGGRHGPGRRPRRPADRRGPPAREHPERLRAHRRRVAYLHGRRRPHDHDPDRGRRVRPRGHRARDRGAARQDRVPRQGRPLRGARRLAAAQGLRGLLRRGAAAHPQAPLLRRPRQRRRAAAPRRPRPPQPRAPQPARGRGPGRVTSSTTTRTSSTPPGSSARWARAT